MLLREEKGWLTDAGHNLWCHLTLTGELYKGKWPPYIKSALYHWIVHMWFLNCLLLNPVVLHDDIIKWKHFMHYWPSVRQQRPVTWRFGVFFDLCLNKCLSKQSWGWWSEMSSPIIFSPSLWRHCNRIWIFTNNTFVSLSLQKMYLTIFSAKQRTFLAGSNALIGKIWSLLYWY